MFNLKKVSVSLLFISLFMVSCGKDENKADSSRARNGVAPVGTPGAPTGNIGNTSVAGNFVPAQATSFEDFKAKVIAGGSNFITQGFTEITYAYDRYTCTSSADGSVISATFCSLNGGGFIRTLKKDGTLIREDDKLTNITQVHQMLIAAVNAANSGTPGGVITQSALAPSTRYDIVLADKSVFRIDMAHSIEANPIAYRSPNGRDMYGARSFIINAQ
jgi:hypothetical protein